jgi:hypothetical protein
MGRCYLESLGMKRSIVFAFVPVLLAAIAPACARGEDTSNDETPLQADAGGPGCARGQSGFTGCPGDFVCSHGECVSPDTDADHDGYPANVDCDDHDPKVHPGGAEICNGKDDNCDGRIDEGFDKDGDGYPTCAANGRPADCDDNDPKVNPGAPEICNEKDDNCDGKIDEGFDKDNDGYFTCKHGDKEPDCDDNDGTVNPGAAEICDTKDNNCNGKIDELPATLTSGAFRPVDAHWVFRGRPAGSPAPCPCTPAMVLNGWAVLTPDLPYHSGALWWSSAYKFDVFEVTATFRIKSGGADGMGFAWVPPAAAGGAPGVGGTGGGFGQSGLSGYGVVIDTLQNAGEIAAPFVVVYSGSLAGTHLVEAPLPPCPGVGCVADGAAHTLKVKFDAPKVTVTVDGTTRLNEFTIPGYAAFTGHWGFTAATGGASATHEVTQITMNFPNGQGCVK